MTNKLEELLKEAVWHTLTIFINNDGNYVVKGKTWLMCGKGKVGIGKTIEEALKMYEEDEYWHCCEFYEEHIQESIERSKTAFS